MAANFEKRDGFIHTPYRLNLIEQQIANQLFDEQIEFDIKEYYNIQKQIKLLKKTCLFKTLIFFFEVPLIFFILGKESLKDRLNLQKLYNDFLFKKININEFDKQMNHYILSITLKG